jgi:hypothetical protein
MLFNKKNTGLLLAGIAAYAAYRYNKMNASEKKEMTDRLKAKGKKIYDDYVPGNVKNWFEKSKDNGGATADAPSYTF